MEDISFETLCVGQEDLGALLDDASKFVENHYATEVNTIGGGKVSISSTIESTTSCLEFFSTRIANMVANRSEYESELEFRIAHSKVHWSELNDLNGASSSKDQGVDHRPYFEKLQKDVHWGPFCDEVTNVVLGKKIGEGAQADIYEAQVTFAQDMYLKPQKKHEYVVKLMKGDCALEDLQRQWPHGVGSLDLRNTLLYIHGALVKDPTTKRIKFGFVMERYSGDLRSLIDLRMEHKNAKGPPFSLRQAKDLIYWIILDMVELHKEDVMHRDLKASNVLVYHHADDNVKSIDDVRLLIPYVADWECSMGVVGTGWWRAPEILLQLKNKTPSSKLEFNEKVDVYSFAMTCYEIATGLLPFEGRLFNSELRDAVLNGVRPKLPHDLDLEIRATITSCWDPNPSFRPSFRELFKKLQNF